MENYDEVNAQLCEEVVGEKDNKRGKLSWNLLMRQILIASAVWTNFFTLGLCLGSPTVIIAQIRRDANSTDVISQEMASWLSSAHSYSGMVLIIILTILPRYLGRKLCFLLISVIAMCGFIFLYFCKTIVQLLLTEIMHGVLSASHITISVMIITEYSSPQYRGIFLTTKSASFLWGVWVSNSIGTFFHWRYIALVGCVSTAYILVTVFMWPESPIWLASKGRYDECASAHHWLKGKTATSEKELSNLLNYYKKSIQNNNKGRPKRRILINDMKMMCQKTFYIPLLLSILVHCLYSSLGKMTCTIYAFDIMKKITNSDSQAYMGMLILDGVTVAGAYIGSGVSKFVKRKSFILTTSTIGIVFLFLLSLYLYLVKLDLVSDNMYISLFLLASYSLAVSCGPLIMASSLTSELNPLTNRNAFALIVGVFGNFCFATFIKIAPYLFKAFGFSGSFLFYATMSLFFVVLLHNFLPETKDKTLLEIENLITNK